MKNHVKHAIKKANQHFQKWKEELDKRKKEREEENLTLEIPQKEEELSEKEVTIDISSKSVFKAALIVVGVYLLTTIFVQLIDILITFLIALFLSAAFNPAVDRLEQRKIPRSVGIILLFLIVIGLLGFLLGTLIPIIADQLIDIATVIEEWARNLFSNTSTDRSLIQQKIYEVMMSMLGEFDIEKLGQNIGDNLDTIANNLGDFATKGMKIITDTLGAIFNVILIFFLTFFLVVDKKNLNDFFHSLFPQKYQGYLTNKMHLVQTKIGEWVHGQILLFFIVGGIAYIGLLIIGVDYALTLALVAGLAEFIPYVGPVIAFATAAPVAFSDSLMTGLIAVAFYAGLQFLEGNVIVPYVMKRSVGLPPVVTIIALIVGASFPNIINPILGMILAVPVATILSIFVRDYTERRGKKEKNMEES